MASKKIYIADDKAAYIQHTTWIKLEEIHVTNRSWIYDYCDDMGEGEKRTAYRMRVRGKYLYMQQFARTSYPATIKSDSGDIVGIISGYDSMAGLDPMPYVLEVHPDGEYVRIWQTAGHIITEDGTDELFDRMRRNGWKWGNQKMTCAACPYCKNGTCNLECEK